MYNVTLRQIHATTVAVEKSISITYSERVFVTLGIQHAMHMCHIVMFGLPHSTIFFSTLSHQWYDFQKYSVRRKMCVLIFSTTFT
jgi:DNA-binding transcriptional MocR family regulator